MYHHNYVMHTFFAKVMQLREAVIFFSKLLNLVKMKNYAKLKFGTILSAENVFSFY